MANTQRSKKTAKKIRLGKEEKVGNICKEERWDNLG